MTEKLIVTDVDGVLIDWGTGFMDWAVNVKGLTLKPDWSRWYHVEHRFEETSTKEHGDALVGEFNNSPALGVLPAWADAQEVIAEFVRAGWKFHAITSVDPTPSAIMHRAQNLVSLFGPDTFVEINCASWSMGKRPFLERYQDQGLVWVEDLKKNALLGADLGYRVFLMDQSPNQDLEDSRITRVQTWKEIRNQLL